MKKIKQKFKKGAASFYIVAFSTLILLIIATSFAAIIISEITRSQNDDLAQSAYDSALAGIEDAKLAVYDYQNCVAEGATSSNANLTDGVTSCDDIVYYVESGREPATDANIGDQCKMVANILGRVPAIDVETREEIGVMIQETTERDNNMQQAYTCVKIQNILKEYNGTLSPTAQTKAVQLDFEGDGENSDISITDRVNKVKVSWYENKEDASYTYKNFKATPLTSQKVEFGSLGGTLVSTPPTISVAVVQTAQTFKFSDFDASVGDKTDRGMVYLVPTDASVIREADKEESKTFRSAWDGTKGENIIKADALVSSNNKEARNLPYAVSCSSPDGEEIENTYACSVMINLPRPVGWSANNTRNDDTFMVVVSLPYGVPTTNFQLEFYCSDTVNGEETSCYPGKTVGVEGDDNRANLENVQIKIDSTGRANDLYRRVEARLESASDNSYLSIMGPLELMGNGDSDALKKVDAVTCEDDFISASNCN